MSAILIRLSQMDNAIKELLIQAGESHDRKKSLLTIELAAQLIKIHPLLMMEYAVCNAKILDLLSRPTPLPVLVDELKSLRMFGDLLIELFEQYLDVPREVHRLLKNRHLYLQALQTLGENITLPDDDDTMKWAPQSRTKPLREFSSKYNPPRLLLVRIKRALTMAAPFFPHATAYQLFIKTVDRLIQPILTQLSWLSFSPRLFANLFLLTKHLVEHPFMKEGEQKLPLLIRLRGQLERRWFEVGNDLPWMTSGLMNCFILVGALSPYAFWLSYSLQVYDIFLAALRCYIEMSRHHALHQDYLLLLRNNSDLYQVDRVCHHIAHLEQRTTYERERVLLALALAIALSVGLTFLMPIFASQPLIPFLGACFCVIITIASQLSQRLLERIKPNEDIVMTISAFIKREESRPLIETQRANAMNALGIFASGHRGQSMSDGNLVRYVEVTSSV